MLGIKHPIVSAPMGPFHTNKLAVAVSEAGGLGVISHVNLTGKNSIEEMKKDMEYVIEHTDKNFGFNIRTARLQPDAVKLCRQIPRFIMENPKIKEQCTYLITSAGSPRLVYNKHFEKLLESGSQLKHFHVAPSVAYAQKCVDMNLDGIVVTGNEGGGHQSYETTSTLVLLQKIRQEFPEIPIIACGGYATGEGLASALSMGAGAIAMGSRFISSNECEFHDNVKEIAVSSDVGDTEMVTGVFGPIRVLKNKFTMEHSLVVSKEQKLAEEVAISGVVKEVNRLEMTYKGDIESGAVLLGQSIGLINCIDSVSNIIEKIVEDAERCLSAAYRTMRPQEIEQVIDC